MTKNIMIVGVGGQGTLLTSRLVGKVMMDNGYDVKVSEVHGMSQRGGSVVTYVRYGECVFSPVIELGEADVIIAFEQLEAARWIPFLKKDGRIIINTQIIHPMPVITGVATYPEDIISKIKATDVHVDNVDALSIAVKCGSPKAINVVLIGVLAKYLELKEEEWMSAIEATVPLRFLELNKAAFKMGYNI